MGLRTLATVGTAVLAGSLLTAAPAQAAPSCLGEVATIVGTKGADELRGTPGRDVIVGRGGSDDIRGRAGDDLICGNIGADALRGGGGEDVLSGGWDKRTFERSGPQIYGDTFRGGAGDDEIRPGDDPREGDQWFTEDRLVYLGAPVGVTVDGTARTVTGRDGTDTYGPGVPVQIVGSRHGDSFSGGPGADFFIGMAGDDSMHGHGGPDRLFAEDLAGRGPRDRDVLRGGGGKDQLEAGPGRDRLHGGPAADRLHDAGGGSDRLFGNTGNDDLVDYLLHGRRHVLDGGPGRDQVHPQTYERGPRAFPSGRMNLRSGRTWIHTRRIFAKVRDVEIIVLPAGRWTFLGTDADEEVTQYSRHRLTAFLRGGDDLAYKGGRSRDSYAGGPGQDTVRDYGGRDRCRGIEVERGPGQQCDRVWR